MVPLLFDFQFFPFLFNRISKHFPSWKWLFRNVTPNFTAMKAENEFLRITMTHIHKCAQEKLTNIKVEQKNRTNENIAYVIFFMLNFLRTHRI